MTKAEIKRIKAVAVGLLATLKREKLRIDHWREREATRDAVRQAIYDFLWSDDTGLPVDHYTDEEVHSTEPTKSIATSTAPTRFCPPLTIWNNKAFRPGRGCS